MRDALTNFGNIAITTSAVDTSHAVGSANIVNMTAPGKTEVTPKDCRLVFYPKTTIASGTINLVLKGSNTVSESNGSYSLSSPSVVQKFEVVNPTVGVAQKVPFPLAVKYKYYQLFAYEASAATNGASNIEAWFEFGA